MRYLITIAIFLPVISCGNDELEVACRWDCRQTWACAFEKGIDYTLDEDLCVENCMDVAENADIEDEFVKGYEKCKDLLACSWLVCMGVDVDSIISHY